MKPLSVFTLIYLCFGCQTKEPIDIALLEINKINGIPNRQTTQYDGTIWLEFRDTFKDGSLKKEKTKNTIDKTLNQIGEGDLTSFKWESPTYKLSLEQHFNSKLDSSYLRFWILKK